MTEHQMLSDLLADLLTPAELLDWLRRLPGGEELPRWLADRAPATLAADAEALLRRHGYLDAELFEALVSARPRREAEIRALGRRLLGGEAGASSAQASRATSPPLHGQTATGGMIFNAPVNVSGGHLGPTNHFTVGAAPPSATPPPSASLDPKIEDLRQLVSKRQVLVICGAGVSLAATGGAPVAGWRGLLQHGVERCEKLGFGDAKWAARQRLLLDEGDTGEWIDVAGRVTSKLGGPKGGEYTRWLRESVGALKATDTALLQAISSLGCPIATTCYDHLLESATGLRPVSWDEPAEVVRALRGDDPGVLHLHGHWRRSESVVFGLESYLRVRNDAHADAARKALGTFHSLLFIGCGATTEDPNIGAWLRWSGEVFAADEHRNYRLEKDTDVAQVQAQHPPEQRLFVLSYGPDHAALPAFLRGLV